LLQHLPLLMEKAEAETMERKGQPRTSPRWLTFLLLEKHLVQEKG
jgi:hypothetical protein